MQLANLNGKAEVFYTLQGEGRSLGMPAIFVRLARCNLACYWCDTSYTWNWTGTKFEHEDNTKFDKQSEIIDIEASDVADLVRQFDCNRVVITGGEPLLQMKNIVELCNELGNDYVFEVETNGTIIPTNELNTCIDFFNVSPKLASSKNKAKLAIKPDVLSWFRGNPKTAFKFVISSTQDFYEVMALIEQIDIPVEQVYLMPEGRSPEAIYEGGKVLAELCKQIGTNFTTRLHVLLWGAKKGV